MTAVEQIQAAIDKLELLREETTTGPWMHAQGVADVTSAFGLIADRIFPWDAELVVTLHRTIDAQLALLRSVAEGFRQFPGDVWATERNNALALARAILGTV